MARDDGSRKGAFAASRGENAAGGRHTHTVSPFTVSRELGHGSFAMVQRVYGHLGQVRHCAAVLEYRVEQHREALGRAPRYARGALTMPTPCRKQDPAALKKLARHVDYECGAFGDKQREIRSWRDFAPSEEESVKRTAVYEMWLVHLRSLVAFFRTKQDQGDEVLACHFMDDPVQWAREHESELQLTPTEYERVGRINHLVAHITYERPNLQSDFGSQDHEMVMKRLRIFYATLPTIHKPLFPRLAKMVQ